MSEREALAAHGAVVLVSARRGFFDRDYHLVLLGPGGSLDATIAALHYTWYERSDVEDTTRRPLFISFNGGPGSSSVWLHCW